SQAGDRVEGDRKLGPVGRADDGDVSFSKATSVQAARSPLDRFDQRSVGDYLAGAAVNKSSVFSAFIGPAKHQFCEAHIGHGYVAVRAAVNQRTDDSIPQRPALRFGVPDDDNCVLTLPG